MRQLALPPITPTVRTIVIGLFACFVLELILQVWMGVPVFELLALDPTAISIATFWQVLTYPLVEHPQAIFSLLLSLLMLWWFLSPFESSHGRKRLLQLCVVATLAAALPALLIGLAIADSTVFARSYLAGADAIALAALAAFAITYRHSQILLFGIFPMKPMHLIALTIGMSVLFFLASRDIIALTAHLGAIGGGIAFVRWMMRPPKRRKRTPSGAEASLRVLRGGRSSSEPPRWLN